MRRTAEITITDEGRDKGKVFLLTELDADSAERWAVRALLALTNSGVDIPDNLEGAGMGAIAAIGVKALAGIRFEEAEPLMAEMMSCVAIKEKHVVRKLTKDDIEEVMTRIKLREEVLSLHINFSLAGYLSTLKAEAMRKRKALSNTGTSQEQ